MSDAESRAFTAFATKVLGQSAQQSPACVEVHRVTVGGETVALLTSLKGVKPTLPLFAQQSHHRMDYRWDQVGSLIGYEVLPDPVGPTSATVSPGATRKLMFFSTDSPVT